MKRCERGQPLLPRASPDGGTSWVDYGTDPFSLTRSLRASIPFA